jgi:5-methylcytosine-specific restriction endonuclease McrA
MDNSQGKKVCVKCGSITNLSRDHIIPKWIYGKAQFFGFKKNLGQKNIQMLCRPCNGRKSGYVDCSSEVGRAFWSKVKETIERELNR